MFQPEIATTWLTPAVVNAAARSRSTRSRSPIRMPAARPASGSGRTRARASAAPRRSSSRRRPGSSDAGRTTSVREDERPGGPDPEQIGAVGRLRPRPDGPFDRDPVTRDDDRVAGQGRRDTERAFGTGRRGQRRGLRPVARRTGRLDDELPRTIAVGRSIERRRPGRDDREADRDQAGAERDRQQGRDAEPWPDLGDEQDRGKGERDRRAEVTRCDLPGGDGRGDRSERQSSGATHLSGPSRGP